MSTALQLPNCPAAGCCSRAGPQSSTPVGTPGHSDSLIDEVVLPPRLLHIALPHLAAAWPTIPTSAWSLISTCKPTLPAEHCTPTSQPEVAGKQVLPGDLMGNAVLHHQSTCLLVGIAA